MAINLLVLMKNLNAHLEDGLHNQFFIPFVFIIILVSLLSPLCSKVLIFFCPLFISTSICSVAVYMFILSGKEKTDEVSFTGENSTHVLKIYDEINLSIGNDNVRMSCFFLKSDIHLPNSSPGEDGEQITFAGKLEADHGAGTFDEDVSLLKLDSLAEGVWNYYLGRYSTWHYQNGIYLYEITD